MIHTLKDFINIIIHTWSQIKGKWFPPIDRYRYLLSWDIEDEIEKESLLNKYLDLSLEEFFYKDFDIYKLSNTELLSLINKTISYLEEKIDFDSKWYELYKLRLYSIEKLSSILYEHLKCISDNKAYYIPYSSSFYPYRLKNIIDPPVCISVKGNLDILSLNEDSFYISIIGSRKACRKSLLESFYLSYVLSKSGNIIVSGGAIGCDIHAHLGAIHAYDTKELIRSNTIVVFAGGLGRLYPQKNIAIFNEVVSKGGLLLSEKLWNYEARKWDFPVRNRIISGLSNSVVLIQAGEKSGASLTCQLALNQGRDLFVLLKEGSYYLGNTRYFEEGALGFFSFKDFMHNKFYKYSAE